MQAFTKLNFSSENFAGVHPTLMHALQKANIGHVPSYGGDRFTSDAIAMFKQSFGDDIDVYFAFNGTGANNFGIGSLTERYQAVYCSDVAHLYVDEGTAPESFTGCRLYPIRSEDGKIIPAELLNSLQRIGDIHHPQPGIVSITQPTEYGTVYTLDEMRVIKGICQDHGLLLHVDGARLFNAAVSLNVPLKTITQDVGVDVLTIGGTKIGMMFGEAVVFFNRGNAGVHKFHLKRSMQLASKNRFIAAQFSALFHDDFWRQLATRPNDLAKRFENEIAGISWLKIAYPVQTNAMFANMPKENYLKLQEHINFYYWNERRQEARFMFSFDNTDAEVTALVKLIKDLGI